MKDKLVEVMLDVSEAKSQQVEVALKFDNGKPPISLVTPEFIEGMAQVLAFGAKKYSKHNWSKGMDWSKVLDSLQRHTLAWSQGRKVDPETGLSDLFAIGVNAMFLAYYEQYSIGNDDRLKRPESK